jgi:hypothetical protein
LVILVSVSASSVLPVIESAPPVTIVIIAASSIREFLSQTFSGVVFGVHKVEATLLIRAGLFAVGLDSRPDLEDGVGVGGKGFRGSQAQCRQRRRIFFLVDLGESRESLDADLGGGVYEVGGGVIDPFNAHWLFCEVTASELFDIFRSHFIDAANMHLFVDRLFVERIECALHVGGRFLVLNTCQWAEKANGSQIDTYHLNWLGFGLGFRS